MPENRRNVKSQRWLSERSRIVPTAIKIARRRSSTRRRIAMSSPRQAALAPELAPDGVAWCAVNFAYLMAEDVRRALLDVEGISQVIVRLRLCRRWSPWPGTSSFKTSPLEEEGFELQVPPSKRSEPASTRVGIRPQRFVLFGSAARRRAFHPALRCGRPAYAGLWRRRRGSGERPCTQRRSQAASCRQPGQEPDH